MAIIRITPTGDGLQDGSSWENAMAGFNDAEDRPVVPGDIVVADPDTYRETHTCDVSGEPGNPITFVGDYDGAYGSPHGGTGTPVRITGSDDDITATRNNCIISSGKDYRTFTGFNFDLSAQNLISIVGNGTTGNNWIVQKSYFGISTQSAINFSDTGINNLVSNCKFMGGTRGGFGAIYFYGSGELSDRGHVIQNSLFIGENEGGVRDARVGGITIINSKFIGCVHGIRIVTNPAAGQTVTVNNSIFYANNTAVRSTTLGFLVENYNSFSGNITARTNVAVGANSNTYPPLFDSRWFFELASRNQKLVSPFDLSSASKLINVAGTSPTTTDLRGQSVIGAQREWGALEYNPNLSRGGGISRGRIV